MQLFMYALIGVAFVLVWIPAPLFFKTIQLGISLKSLSGIKRIHAELTHKKYWKYIFASFIGAIIAIESLVRILSYEGVHRLNVKLFSVHIVFALLMISLLILIRVKLNGSKTTRTIHRLAAYSTIVCYSIALILGMPLMYAVFTEIRS